MEWEFTPQQVVKGEVGYGLEAFRHDLMQEVSLNVQGIGEEQLNRSLRSHTISVTGLQPARTATSSRGSSRISTS